MDSAWKSKQYEIVLSLLQKDHLFPDGFDAEILDEEDEVQCRLKVFAKERNRLHKLIKNNDLEKVKELTSKKTESKFYFNHKNKSAAFTSLKKRNFKIYAYLQSIGVNLGKDEPDEMENLTTMEKQELKDIMLSYFPRDEKAHIYHLMSKIKIKSQKPFEQCRKKLFAYLERLNDISSVSIILKVMQYVEHLDLVLDLDDENVKTVCPTATTAEKGITYPILNTIYVAAGADRTENEILGTLAHEMTHLAMEIIFENNSDPYFKSDNFRRDEFRNIAGFVYEHVEWVQETPSETLCGAFGDNYTEAGQEESELIARVPHILAQYPDGEDWLLSKVPNLAEFFKNKVIPECEKFILGNSLLTFKSLNRFMNESEGEIINIKKSFLAFRDINKIRNFLNIPNKNIFALFTDYTWLCLLRTLQAAYGVKYAESYDKFLVYKLENVLKTLEDVEYLFNSEATEMLFIEFPSNVSGNQTSLKKISRIMDIVRKKKNKKVIMVMKEVEIKNITEIVKECGLNEVFVSETIDDFSVNQLTENSRQKLLNYEILFQGIECNLSELINDNEDLLETMNAEIIQDLLDNKKIEIGSKPLGMNSLEGAYADFSHEVNLESLFDEMKLTESIFVVRCKKTSNPDTDIKKCLTQNINESLIAQLKNLECKISNSKRIFLSDDEVKDDEFRRFCNLNSGKKIYLLERRDGCQFILLKFYNPDFYFKRQFRMYEKVVVKKDILKQRNSGMMEDLFIIGKDSTAKLQNNSNSPNIRLVDLNNMYEHFTKFFHSGQIAHFLKFENDQLVWQKSVNSLSGLRPWIDPDLREEKIITDENELRSKIMKEKVVILADEPGMGKTTTLTKLYEYENIFDNYWVVRINLKDHLKAIKNINDKVDDIKQVMQFLTQVDTKLKNSISEKLLVAVLDIRKKFSKGLLLCFDGFDELLDDKDREKVLNLLAFLKNETKCKIWITTRLHYKEDLENRLSVFSIKFDLINNQSKVSFIKNYMNVRLKLILAREKYDEVFGENGKTQEEPKLTVFTERLLNRAKEIFKGDIEKFIGTPLQLHLLLEGSTLFFRNWIENSVDLDFSYLGNNLVEVYERYFDRKCDIFFKKKNLIEEGLNRLIKYAYNICHEQLADYLINSKPLLSEFMQHKSLLLSLGIIKDEGENLQFFHFTFREYFFAQSFMNDLMKCFKDNKTINKKLQNLMKEIFTEKRFQLTRTFINVKLENTSNKQKFLKIIGLLWEKNADMSKGCVCLRFAIEENHNHIFYSFLSHKLSPLDYYTLLNRFSDQRETLLHVAVEAENEYACNLLIDKVSKLSEDNQFALLLLAENVFQKTVLQLAAEKGYINIVKKITDIIKNKDNLLRLLCNPSGSPEFSYQSALGIAINNCNYELAKFLFEKTIEIIPKKKKPIFFGFKSRTNNMTILQLAAAKGRIEMFNLILEKAKEFFKDELSLMRAKDWNGHDVLDYAVLSINCELVKIVLQIIFSKKKDYDDYISSVRDSLHLATTRNCVEVVYAILKETEKEMGSVEQLLKIRGEQNRNILHYAVQYSYFEIIELILEKARKIFTKQEKFFNFLFTTDRFQQNILHLVAITNYNRVYECILKNRYGSSNYTQHNEVDMIKIEMNSGDSNYKILPGTSKNNQGKVFRLITDTLKTIPQEQQYELISKKNSLYQTLLHLSCMTDSIEIINWIFENFDWQKQYELLCLRDIYNQTALHWAVVFGHIHICKLLMEKILIQLPKEKLEEFLSIENKFGDNVFDLVGKHGIEESFKN